MEPNLNLPPILPPGTQVVTEADACSVSGSVVHPRGAVGVIVQAPGDPWQDATRVDPSLLGGIKVKVGSRLFDASLRSKLDSLKFALKRA